MNDKKADRADDRKAEAPLAEGEDRGDSLARLAESDSSGGGLRIGARLRNYFLTGLVIVGPVSITIYIVWWFINVIDAWIKPLVPDVYNPDTYLPVSIPGVGLVFAIVMLTLIGALAANLFGRTLISYGETVVGRMPVVRNVYRGLKQLFETVLSQSSGSFQRVALVEYPRRGLYAIVFISTETKGEVAHKWEGDSKLVSVFLPTTPNPTSGYLLFVPENDILELDMTVEEAAKMVISAGLVTPEYQSELKSLADEARHKQQNKQQKKSRQNKRKNAKNPQSAPAPSGEAASKPHRPRTPVA